MAEYSNPIYAGRYVDPNAKAIANSRNQGDPIHRLTFEQELLPSNEIEWARAYQMGQFRDTSGENIVGPTAQESERDATARKMLALYDQYGATTSADLPPEVRQQMPYQGTYRGAGDTTFGRQFADFVTSPAFLVAAGGLGAMYAAPAAAGGVAQGGGAAGGAAGGTGITTGAVGQTGLTLGTATGGIGGGALGSGLTTGGTAAGAGTAAAGAGALGAGYFGSETAYPVIGGQTAAATGAGTTAGTTAGTAASGTALSRLLNGTATQDDYLALAGQVAPSLLQMYGANQQQKQLSDLADKYMAMGAPYRDQLASISQDPNQFYNSPGAQQALDATLRKLSVQGNPAGSPYAQSLAIGSLYDRYGQERQLLGNLGGLSGFNAAAPQSAQNAIGAGGQFYNAIGTGLGNVLNPQPSLADTFKKYGGASGQYGYGY